MKYCVGEEDPHSQNDSVLIEGIKAYQNLSETGLTFAFTSVHTQSTSEDVHSDTGESYRVVLKLHVLRFYLFQVKKPVNVPIVL